MAINFPNYLAAQLYKPDYSGISDAVENYYKGKAMPKDDLIRQIQAQFARPNAEAALAGTRLGNQKSQLEIGKLRTEMAQQAQLEAAISAALRGGSQGPAAGMGQQPNPAAMAGNPAPMMPQPNPNNMTFQGGQQADVGNLHPAIAQVIQQMRQQQGQQGQQQSQPEGMPAPQEAPQQPEMPSASPSVAAPSAEDTQPNPLQILTQGEPRLAAIDALYDQNPLSRALLEKKGFKKSQKIDFDKKTGQTRIMTTYPSGKVTLQVTSSAGKSEDGIPLTNKMISMHQRVVSSIDSALPLLEKLRNLKSHSNTYLGNFTATHGQREYKKLVNGLKDHLIGAYALNPTDKGLETANEQLIIGGWETEGDYKKGINDLINILKDKRQYSATEVKKSNKIQPVNRSDGSGDYDNLDKYDSGSEAS